MSCNVQNVRYNTAVHQSDVMQVTVPRWIVPTGRVELAVQATSYIGADISNATMKATWTAGVYAIGALSLTTDAAGAASSVIDLGALPADKRPKAGDSLQVGCYFLASYRPGRLILHFIVALHSV